MTDINQPVENPALVEALEKYGEALTEEALDLVIAELKKARFLCPFTIEPPPAPGPGITQLPEGTTMKIALEPSPEGPGQVFPTFTDWNELLKWRNEPDQQTLVVSLDDFPGMLGGKNFEGFFINPESHRLFLTRERLSYITGQVQSYTLTKETTYRIGVPAVWPEALTEALSAHMRAQPAIRTAWLHLLHLGEAESLLLTVDFKGDRTAVFNEIGRVAQPHLAGKNLDLVDIYNELGVSAIRLSKPFYPPQVSIWERLRRLFGRSEHSH